MKGMRLGILVVGTAVLAACLWLLPVGGVPVPPCTFWGSVSLNGSPVADGTEIRARLASDGTLVGTATSSGSDYNMIVPQNDAGVPGEGAGLNFYVVSGANEYLGGTDTWEAGELKELNLSAVSAVTYTLTVTVTPAGSGTVTRSPDLPQYPSGTSVTLTAVPSAGYAFSHWSGDLSGSANPATIMMNANKAVTANFASTACNNSPTPVVGLASIYANLVAVYGYRPGEGVGGWTIFRPDWVSSHPSWNTLTNLYRGRGYWVNVNAACQLAYGSWNTPSNPLAGYDLESGWNLIGWMGC